MAWLGRLLTLDDWVAVPKDDSHGFELVEGLLIVSPRPDQRHEQAVLRLAAQLEPQLPIIWGTLRRVELVVDPGPFPTVRMPDLLVGTEAGIEDELPRWSPEKVCLVAEIMSDGTRRTDRVAKLAEYAEAGIENYWLIDMDEPMSLRAFRLMADRYECLGTQTGRIALPLLNSSVTIDLPALTGRRTVGQAQL
ncbi:Uma2 family endonuclease [Nocardia sp. NPDC004722]